jgi:hypothetical protein
VNPLGWCHPARSDKWGAVAVFFVAFLLQSKDAGGEETGRVLEENARTREAYESDLIEQALSCLGLCTDPKPANKLIERLEIVRFPVVEQNDPWPNFLNLFHVTTREHIIRQELLFSEGDSYQQDRVQESARNLRAWPLTFSMVRIVAAKGSTPDQVVIVVITKDLWSIRLNSQFSVGGGVFNYLSLMPTEQNFLGFNQQVSLITYIDRATVSLGQIYRVPRVLGTRLSLMESANLRMNHQTGEQEGGFGSFSLGRPLYSVKAEWGFSLDVAADVGVNRFYQGADLQKVLILQGAESYVLPHLYQHKLFTAMLSGVRSFGEKWKVDLQAGYEIRYRKYLLADDFPIVPDPVRETYMKNTLPISSKAGVLLASVRMYEARFRRLQNIQTYGLSEDFRFGPEANIEVDFANPAFGYNEQSVRLIFNAGWMFSFGQDILSLQGSLSARYMSDHDVVDADTEWIDRRGHVEIENVSPELMGIGRLFVRFAYTYNQYRQDKAEEFLGGDNTLRGFISGYCSGPRLFNVNVEFRSRPWVIRTLHWGIALFYDGGDAYGFMDEKDFNYHQSVGFGIRGLFPQFDRGVMRLDVGVPLGKDFHSRTREWITLAYLQAF